MKNTMANATIEAAIKRFWDFIKGFRMINLTKKLVFDIKWTGETTEISGTHYGDTWCCIQYEDKTITPNDFKEYFDSQNIPYRGYDDYCTGYANLFEIIIPKDISPYITDKEITNSVLASFTYEYYEDKDKPILYRIDSPDNYPEKLDWNCGRVTVHCHIGQNPLQFLDKKLQEGIEKIMPQFIQIAQSIYEDKTFFYRKMIKLEEQTKGNLFLKGWTIQKTMIGWEKILKNNPGWKMGDLMVSPYGKWQLVDKEEDEDWTHWYDWID